MPAKAVIALDRREHPTLCAVETPRKEGEVKLLKQKLSTHVLLCLTLLAILAVGPVMAQELPPQGICLYREPAPPMAVLNDGTGVVMFYWTIDYATNANQDYVLEIVPPGSAAPFVLNSFPPGPSPIIDTAIWEVPAGTPAGCYYGRLTFFSDWCLGSPNKFEDRAVVGFIVSPAARLQLCKFWDFNGNGVWDCDEPPLAGWQFVVQRATGGAPIELVTGADGCTQQITVPVEAEGATTYTVEEVEQPGWVKTTPDGDTNPFSVDLTSGEERLVEVGNWQPVTISGYKFLEEDCWPCTSTPENCTPRAGVQIDLYDKYGALLDSTVTDADGYFQFPANMGQDYIQYDDGYILAEVPQDPIERPLAYETDKPAVCDSHELSPWLSQFCCTASESPWQDPGLDFATPDDIQMILDQPTETYQDYGDNVFYNRLPSRIFGFMCMDAVALDLGPIVVEKDGETWPAGDSACCPDCGFYYVSPLDEEPEGLRPGEYVLTPPELPNGKHWVAYQYYVDINGQVQKRELPVIDGSVTVTLASCDDIRVDFCIAEENNKRQCYLPVTFTAAGWQAFAAMDNKIVANGMIYTKFPKAFASFSFFGETNTSQVRLLVGTKTKSIRFDATTINMQRLVAFLGQTGRPGKLAVSYVNPTGQISAGTLASETIALQMNIAYNDQRLMPRTPGYDLERFILTQGLFKGKTVGQVLDIANAVLGGDLPARYGLPKDPNDSLDTGYNALVAILRAINSNFEFVDFNTYNDRGYLTGWTPGPPKAVVQPKVPYGS